VNCLPGLALKHDPPNCSCQVARIIGVNHQDPIQTIDCGSLFLLNLLYAYFFFLWDWGLNSGLQTCKAGTFPLESHVQFLFFFMAYGTCHIS
jgi:hypothetical protein